MKPRCRSTSTSSISTFLPGPPTSLPSSSPVPTRPCIVDAGFTRADGHRLVAAVLDSGKRLKTIFISYADPDYYFGLEVLVDAFPDAVVLATRIVVDHIRASFEGKLTAWKTLGANLPTRHPQIEALHDDFVDVDGYRFEVKGAPPALPDRSYLWNADYRAILGGVLLFQNEHVWTADTPTVELRKAWIELLDELSSLDAELVVAGHRLPGTPNDSTAIDYTRNYLEEFDRIIDRSDDGTAMTAALVSAYPESGMLIAAEIGPKVAKGEMTWG